MNASSKSALIIVDVQNDFCPGGALAIEDGKSIIPAINALKSRFSVVVLTQDWHPPTHKSFASQHPEKQPFEIIDMPYGRQVLWPDHCIQGTSGADFHKDLTIGENDMILRKGSNPEIDSYSGFYENDHKTQPRFENGQTLTVRLKAQDVEEVILCGLAYDFCVGWHALDARQEGFEVTVLKGLTRSIAMPSADPKASGAQNTEEEMDHRLLAAGVDIIMDA